MATRAPSRRSHSSTNSQPSEPPELADFVGFCSELRLEGKPFVLEDFQRTILRDYFAGTRQTLVIVPKKNGKSTLVAALALYHLLVTEDAEGYIAANARDQAMLILNQARKFIRGTVALKQYLEVQAREIRHKHDGGFVKVLAADKDTVDGVIPTFAIVDELHRAKSTDLMGVFRDGLGPRDGKMITITTAGDDSESALGKMRSEAYAMPTVERVGSYRYARSRNGQWVMHEWALDDSQDRGDMEVVKTANPASWMTVDRLQERRDDPSTTPWQWARFACGVWLQGEDTAIGPVEWAACGTDVDPPAGLLWRIGLDLGFSGDTTAAVPHALDEDGVAYLGLPRILVPPRAKGVSLRKRDVLVALEEIRDEFGADEVVCDPSRNAEVFVDDLEDAGFEVVGHSQQPGPMAQAAERFYSAVREGKLWHPGDPAFSRHVLNAVKRSTVEGAWTFVKESKSSEKHIDGLIAAAMVHNVAVDEFSTAKEPMAAWI